MQRTWVHFPGPTNQLTTTWDSSSRGPKALFWPLQLPTLPCIHFHTTGAHNHHEKINKNKYFFKEIASVFWGFGFTNINRVLCGERKVQNLEFRSSAKGALSLDWTKLPTKFACVWSYGNNLNNCLFCNWIYSLQTLWKIEDLPSVGSRHWILSTNQPGLC